MDPIRKTVCSVTGSDPRRSPLRGSGGASASHVRRRRPRGRRRPAVQDLRDPLLQSLLGQPRHHDPSARSARPTRSAWCDLPSTLRRSRPPRKRRPARSSEAKAPAGHGHHADPRPGLTASEPDRGGIRQPDQPDRRPASAGRERPWRAARTHRRRTALGRTPTSRGRTTVQTRPTGATWRRRSTSSRVRHPRSRL